jgi:hypothetical protein
LKKLISISAFATLGLALIFSSYLSSTLSSFSFFPSSIKARAAVGQSQEHAQFSSISTGQLPFGAVMRAYPYSSSGPLQYPIHLYQNQRSPPIAKAVPNQIVHEDSTVMLDGSRSYDPNPAGIIANYRWVQISGIPVTLFGSNTANPSFIAPQVRTSTTSTITIPSLETTLTFSLTVTDSYGITSTNPTTVNVIVTYNPEYYHSGPYAYHNTFKQYPYQNQLSPTKSTQYSALFPNSIQHQTPLHTATTNIGPTILSSVIWHPALNTNWQWQLTGIVDQSFNVAMYDIDMFDNAASVVTSLHNQGRKVICYISAGTWENWRPDAAKFPNSVKGHYVAGYPNERWLDIRQINILGPIMNARMDLCKQKGFDGIEPDNIDGYQNNPGFPITYQDQIKYNEFLANQAHIRGLSIALKNDLDQVKDLLPYFDWALNEECFAYNECSKLLPFINTNKAVFEVEYNLLKTQFCPQANAMNFNSMKKHLDLGAWRSPCR